MIDITVQPYFPSALDGEIFNQVSSSDMYSSVWTPPDTQLLSTPIPLDSRSTRHNEYGEIFRPYQRLNRWFVGPLTSAQWVSQGNTDLSPSHTNDPVTGLSLSDGLGTQPDASYSTQNVITSQLDWTDENNPTRLSRFKDDYLLSSDTTGQIDLDMVSSDMDTYLQVIDIDTGEVLAFDDDSGWKTDSYLTFEVEAGQDYIIRATSYGVFETGTYTLVATPVAAPILEPAPPPEIPSPTPSPTPTPISEPPPISEEFDIRYGYGLVNAATAVTQALSSDLLAEGSNAEQGWNNTLANAIAQALGNDSLAEVANAEHSWNNNLVNAPEVWEQGYTGDEVVVAVVDSGVDFTHADLDDNIWLNEDEIPDNGIDDDGNGYIDDVLGWDFVEQDNTPMDRNGHGTHVAGTIAAERNDEGITGVAYGAKIMPIKVLGENGFGLGASIADGIRYAVDNGADVINLSLGGDRPNGIIQAAIRYATDQGAIVVMAAGNEGAERPGYPAGFATDYGFSVGAVDRFGNSAPFSNRAGQDSSIHHVMAPGVAIESTIPGDRYDSFSGTSMATPHVAGVIALMLSANPDLTPEQVRQIIIDTTTDLGTIGPAVV